MNTYDIEALALTTTKDDKWEWDDRTANACFSVEARDEDEAEAAALRKIAIGGVTWRDENGKNLPSGVTITDPDIVTVEEAW